MAMKFPMYVSTNTKTISVVGLISTKKKDKKENYINQKGYIDDKGTIWIFCEKGKPKCSSEYPYFWFNEEGKKEFSEPTQITLNAFNEENMIDMSLVNIVDKTLPDEKLYDEEEINDMNAASAFFIPKINKDKDDYLKKIVKAVIIEKGVDINRLKNKTDEKYQIPNMRSALMNDTKMSVLYFCIWMNLLGCDFEVTVRNNGLDGQNPLKEDIKYDSYSDRVGTIVNGEIKDMAIPESVIKNITEEGEEDEN